MMIVVASMRLSGFFAVAIAHAKRPLILLRAVVATSGVFSAFLVNDAICLVLTPLVLQLTWTTVALGRRPAPYLLAVAMASNVGSVATITGNPQNMMIGSYSHIPYTQFALALAPVALVGLIVTVALIALFYREEFFGGVRLQTTLPRMTANRALAIRALLATLVLIAASFAGVVPAKAALIIGGLLLLTRRVKSRRVYAEIDWSLLLIRGPVRYRRRRAARASQPRHHRRRRPASPRSGASAQRADSGVVQLGQQRARRIDAEAVCRGAQRPRQGVVDYRDGFDAGRQFHRAWLGRQPDRRADSRRFRRDDQLLGLFPSRRAADYRHAGDRNIVAVVVKSSPLARRWPR